MSDASDLRRKHRPTTAAATFAMRAAYLAVWLSLAWCLAFFAHAGRLGISRGAMGEPLGLLGSLLFFKGNILLVLVFHYLAVTGIRPSLQRLWLPDNLRVLAAAGGLLLLSLPTGLTGGPFLGVSAALMLLASVICVQVSADPEPDPAAGLYSVLGAAAALSLLVVAGAGVRDIPKTTLYGWSIGTEEAAAAAQRLQTPDEAMFTVRRLRPGSIGSLPGPVAADLRAAGCTVPQSAFEKSVHNLFSAPLQDSKRFDWAVLCSRGTDTAIHVVWADPKAPGTCPSELARVSDKGHLLEIGRGRLGYSRLIRPAQQGYLLNRDVLPGEAPVDIPAGVLGIEDESVNREVKVHYCVAGAWISVAGVRRFEIQESTTDAGGFRGMPMAHELHGNPIP